MWLNERLEINEAPVEKTTVETRGPQSVRMIGVPALPSARVGEFALRIVAHDRRVAIGTVIELTTVEYRPHRQLKPERLGVKTLPRVGISEVRLGIISHGNSGIERY